MADILVIRNKRPLTYRIKANVKGEFDKDDHARMSDVLRRIEEVVREAFPNKQIEVKL